jgi:hypothetical protein
MSESAPSSDLKPKPPFALWLGMLGPPIVWLTQFEINYALAGVDPGGRGQNAIMVTSFVALACLAGLIALSWHHFRTAGDSPLERFAGVIRRTRFMSFLGLLLGGLFSILTLAQGVAQFFLEPGLR